MFSDTPTHLGPYEIAAKIAGGGMASVYLGRASTPGRPDRVAAIKAIRGEFAGNEQFVTMFMDEAKILSRLDHPNIARTLEYGIEEHQHYIAMELLLGRTLLDVWDACVARSLPLRLELAAWICARVADGLHYAHELCDEQGYWLQIVHRDVNPSNVFLTYSGEVKLFDFGLARARGMNHKTAAGIVKGKVAYLSPEQLQQLPVDRRVDLFALGTTLWELTTMKRLFRRDQDLATVLAIKDAKVPDPRVTLPAYPDELWRIVQRALAKDRDERYQRASDLARDLDAFVGQADGAMRTLVGTLQDNLFEGDRERQMGWLKRTSALAVDPSKGTNPPPAPLPTAHVRSADELDASARLAQFLAVDKPPSKPPPRK